MNLLIATLPDESDALPGWLERHLCGPSLAELAAELTAVHGHSSATTTARALLGDDLPDVLAFGLSRLPPAALRRFLHQPALFACAVWQAEENGCGSDFHDVYYKTQHQSGAVG